MSAARRWSALLGAALGWLIAMPGPAAACGLEDPASIGALRGALNLSYPESLHVGTAVWQAQLAGRLPRDPVAQRADLSPEARGQFRLLRATLVMRRLAAMLAADPKAHEHPSLAVVLIGPVLWTRIDSAAGTPEVRIHAPGPASGDLVLVTDLAAVEALAAGTIGFDEALQRGLLRLYGPAHAVDAGRAWLQHTLRSTPA
jgi:hypothetical protein